MNADIDAEQTPAAQITRLYLVTLGRRPDRTGLEAYVGHLQGGMTLEDIAAAFIASEEFLAHAGDEPVPVVLYRNAHAAMPTQGWLALNRQAPEALAAALVRDPIVRLRLPTPRHLEKDADLWPLQSEIARLYLIVLGRRPDPAGFASYLEQRRSGTPLEDIAAAFIESGEFSARCHDDAPSLVLYRSAHGVAPSPAWLHANGHRPGAAAAMLVADPAVACRLSVLDALYPDGLLLEDPALYRRWLAELAQPEADEREAMRRSLELPAISWVMLLDDPRPDWLDAAVASVQAQHAAGVELLLVSGGRFGAAAIRRTRDDARIRLIKGFPWDRRERLLGRALDAVTTEFVGILGQHDLLHDTASYEIAVAGRSADMVIGDEDAIDVQGRRHSPRFATFQDPGTLLTDARTNAFVTRTSMVRAAGGLGTGAEASQDLDLVSRVMASAKAVRLRHVPVLLCSRRDRPATTRARGVHWTAPWRAGRVRGSLRAHDPARAPQAALPMASIIVATRDRASLLRTCLQGVLERTDYPALEVLVLDNGSREKETLVLLDRLAQDPRVRVLRSDDAFNWSVLNNRGVREMRGDVAVLLNNDTEVLTAGWLKALVSHALRPDVGIVGAKLLYPDRSVQHAGMVLGPAGRATHMWRHSDGEAAGYMNQLVTVRDVAAVTGACVAMRREVFERTGGLEESLPVTWSDVDLCLKVRELGLRVVWTPHAVLLHHEQASRGTDETAHGQSRLAREKAWMLRRWGEAMDVDPFLSPNMLPGEAHPLLAPVPRRRPPWQGIAPGPA